MRRPEVLLLCAAGRCERQAGRSRTWWLSWRVTRRPVSVLVSFAGVRGGLARSGIAPAPRSCTVPAGAGHRYTDLESVLG